MKAAILYKANTPLEVVDIQEGGSRAVEARVKVMRRASARATGPLGLDAVPAEPRSA